MIEKTSPPVPVEVAPEASTSSASQVIAPTQVTGMCRIDVTVPVEETVDVNFILNVVSTLYHVYIRFFMAGLDIIAYIWK